jgi:hypothetical protein
VGAEGGVAVEARDKIHDDVGMSSPGSPTPAEHPETDTPEERVLRAARAYGAIDKLLYAVPIEDTIRAANTLLQAARDLHDAQDATA